VQPEPFRRQRCEASTRESDQLLTPLPRIHHAAQAHQGFARLELNVQTLTTHLYVDREGVAHRELV
jgi:hypothetical protein